MQMRMGLSLACVVIMGVCSADPMRVSYSMMGGKTDVRAADYRVDGDVKNGCFSFRPLQGSPEWLRLSLGVSLNGRVLSKLSLVNGTKGVVARASMHTLVYTNGEARVELEFHPEKAVLRLEMHRDVPLAVREVEIGLGSSSDSGLLFDPSVRFTPYHDFPVTQSCVIRPGLASPPPWLLSYRHEGRPGCWSVALEPDPERLDFVSFEHIHAEKGSFHWKVRYPRVDPGDGDFTVPPLVFRFGDRDFLTALERHVADVRSEGKMIVPDRRLPAWHAERIACTWRYQRDEPRREQATEDNCENFVRMLENNGIAFGTLIIDDFWGEKRGIWEADPRKWTDLRGFIDRQHAKGRHVLLWVCTDGEGLPENERIGKLWNPESPAYLARLKVAARKMLSSDAGCYNADGIKFDFTSSYPDDCRGLRHVGCGFIRERFRVLSEAMLSVKPDAILDYQCTNPYFTHTLTMLRLNDYFGVPEHGLAEMRLRAEIAKICAPGALIDTDHISFGEFPYAGGYDFFRACREFGVESLYLGPKDMEDEELLSILKCH